MLFLRAERPVPHRATNAEAIGLALSGGGIRAAVFHLGMLKQLATQGLLERVAYLSTVSGGSLLAGLVFHHSDRYLWPSSAEFIDDVYPKVAETLRGTNLQKACAWDIAKPWNWSTFVPSRASALAKSIVEIWKIKVQLGELPGLPAWEIGATSIEFGTRFTFRLAGMKPRPCEHGVPGQYVDAKSVWLADALAASAAFPGAFTPLELPRVPSSLTRAPVDGWTPVGAIVGADTVQLMDGGLYDNLGLEPLVDLVTNTIKPECQCDFVLVSDGGAPVKRQRGGTVARLLGIDLRIMGIMCEQTRTLRVRSFRGMLSSMPTAGALVTIGSPEEGTILPGHRGEWPPDHPARIPTLLQPLSKDSFVRVEMHGFNRTRESLKLPDSPSA